MSDVRLSLPVVSLLVAVVGAGAFAAGRAMPNASQAVSPPPQSPAAPAEMAENDEPLPPGHPPTTGAGAGTAGALPAGHPRVDSQDQGGGAAAGIDPAPAADSPLQWKAPARWELVPNSNKMRLATYRVPRAPGDTADAELSITQAGGSVDANAERWVGQFDAAGQKTAKRSTRKVGSLDVAVVEVQGTYSGGMGKDGSGAGWALLGAIVSTPGMPHFFKLTGPAKTVSAAHAEFDALIASLVQD
jgi:hypothetical protein